MGKSMNQIRFLVSSGKNKFELQDSNETLAENIKVLPNMTDTFL